MVHTFNPTTWEAEAGGFLSFRPAWSTEWDQDSHGYTEETLSQKQTNKQKQMKCLCGFISLNLFM